MRGFSRSVAVEAQANRLPNLAANAFEALDGQGRITISAADDDDRGRPGVCRPPSAIDVSSTPDAGTRFRVTLPVTSASGWFKLRGIRRWVAFSLPMIMMHFAVAWSAV
jgi:hypothetical protein